MEFCQENTLVIANTHFQQHKRRLYTWTSPDGPSPSDSPITSWQIDGYTVATVATFILGAPKSLHVVIAAMKLKDACSLEGKLSPTLTAY